MKFSALTQAWHALLAAVRPVQPVAELAPVPPDLELLQSIMPGIVDCARCYA